MFFVLCSTVPERIISRRRKAAKINKRNINVLNMLSLQESSNVLTKEKVNRRRILNVQHNLMKVKFLLFIITFSFLELYSQSICDSLDIEPDTFFINQSFDTVVFDTLTYSGPSDISYSECYFIFSDTTYIDIKESAFTHGISGPFTFSKWNGYRIIYNTTSIPLNTIVNAQYGVYHAGITDPIIDCLLPITFIINGTTGLESVHEESSLNIFPNPFSTQTTLQSGNVFDDATLTVYNCFGQTIRQVKRISGLTITLHRENLPNGLYFIRLAQRNKIIATSKLEIAD